MKSPGTDSCESIPGRSQGPRGHGTSSSEDPSHQDLLGHLAEGEEAAALAPVDADPVQAEVPLATADEEVRRAAVAVGAATVSNLAQSG